jgi:PhnB protein
MATLNVYLNFDGNCEEAFNFYKSVFHTEFNYLGRFKDIPESVNSTHSASYNEKIMHVGLPIGNTVLMGSDCGEDFSPLFKTGNNFAVSYGADSKETAERIFNELSNGGTILMPMENTFWGEYFGMLIDPFGINWMISFNPNTTI